MSNDLQATEKKLLSRRELQRRWGCSGETIKRRQRAGLLRPIYFSARMLRYALDNVLEIEAAASARTTQTIKRATA